MRLYSTNNKSNFVTLEEALFKGLPSDNGLYMPESIQPLNVSIIQNLKDYSFQDIGFMICRQLFQRSIPENDLKEIVDKSINFPAPLIEFDDHTYILELFHGPSLAFKDFGARFMAQLMSYFNKKNERELVILVATSGDTGGAVAAGFYKATGIRVVILYPSGKVSDLQEKQLTTFGENITAIEVNGTFDDCQALVKQAFLDKDLTKTIRLSSANSINIARLVPQSFYYFEAYKQLPSDSKPVVFSIPSGNFGNLTAGLFAKKLGLPIYKFIAATNVNDVVPSYLNNGTFIPRPSIATLSNAMDVGNPSNFARMLDIYGSTWNNIRADIKGYAFDDRQTEAIIRSFRILHNYTLDPHGAVGILALNAFQSKNPGTRGIVLETAHPSKFLENIERILDRKIEVPERLAILSGKNKNSIPMRNNYREFKEWLTSNY